MSFRDPAKAAHARAEALADALAEKEAELEALRAQLAAKDEELRGVQENVAPLLEVDRDLKELAARGQRAEEEAARRKAEADRTRQEARAREEARERERRRLSSVSVWGDFRVREAALVVPVPTFYLTAVLALSFGKVFILLVPCAVVVLLFGLKASGLRRARRAWEREQAWARSHPYPLAGYLDLLELELGTWRTHTLTLEIRLRDPDGASELEAILKSFDVELKAWSPARSRPRWSERSNAPEEAEASGSRTFCRTLNGRLRTKRQLRQWMHRLQAEIFTRVHARYGIAHIALGVEER